MAEVGVEPVAANPLLARRALDAHLARRGGDDPVIERIAPLVVHVPVSGVASEGTTDDFLLRLGFTHYDEWPPSAQFVNPETGTFVIGEDEHHLPRITGSNELQVHAAYDHPAGHKIQLVCSSATLEFYEVRHGMEAKHLWQPGVHTLWTTISAVRHHLRHFYQGRFA